MHKSSRVLPFKANPNKFRFRPPPERPDHPTLNFEDDTYDDEDCSKENIMEIFRRQQRRD